MLVWSLFIQSLVAIVVIMAVGVVLSKVAEGKGK